MSKDTGVGSVFAVGLADLENKLGRFPARPAKRESSEEHFERMLSDLNESPRRWNTPALESVTLALAGDQGRAIVKKIHKLSKSYQDHLRECVDEWLGTGRDASGADTPSSRKPNARIDRIVHRVFDTHPARPIRLAHGYTVSPLPAPTLPDHNEGLDAAQLRFADMLIGDWALKIAKCLKCGLYFKLRHWDRHYKDGTVCAPCMPRRRDDRAKKKTKENRQKAERTLYEMAAKRFRKQVLRDPAWYRNPKTKMAMAQFLNHRISRNSALEREYKKGITGKWFSWAKNHRAITEAAKGIGRV